MAYWIVGLLVLVPRGISCYNVARWLFSMTDELSLAVSVAVLVVFFTLRTCLTNARFGGRGLIGEVLLAPASVFLGLKMAPLVAVRFPYPIAVAVILVASFLFLQVVEAVALHDLPVMVKVLKRKLGK